VKYSNINNKLFRSRRRGDEYFQELSLNWAKIERSTDRTITTERNEPSLYFLSFRECYFRDRTETDFVVGGESTYWMIPEYTAEERCSGIVIKRERSLMMLDDFVVGGESTYWMIPEYTAEERCSGIVIKRERSLMMLARLHQKLLKRLIQDNPEPTCDYDVAENRYSEFMKSFLNSEKLLQELVASGCD
jgi:hypothetical protein